MLAALVGTARARPLGPWLWLLVPARFFILGLAPAWSDAAGAVCGFLLWNWWLAGRGRRDLTLAAILFSAIVVRGLAPFEFTVRAQPFYWVPFSALWQTAWQSGVAVVLHKIFLYGSGLWLCLAAGIPGAVAAAGAVFILSALEAVQVYLPAHVAESTDPILALLLACLLTLGHKRPAASQRVRKRRVRRPAPSTASEL